MCSTYKFHVVSLMFLMLLLLGVVDVVVVVVFLHTTNKPKKEQVLFCKICATASEVFWGIWTICHISIMAAVFALCFVNIFYYFCEILHLLLLYRQWRSVAVTCSGVCASVWGRACVWCWKLEFLLWISMETFPALHSAPVFLCVHLRCFSKTCSKGAVVLFCLVHCSKKKERKSAEPKNKSALGGWSHLYKLRWM